MPMSPGLRGALTLVATAGALTATLIAPGSPPVAVASPAAPARASAVAAVVGPTRPNILLINLDDARYDAFNYLPKTRSWMEFAARRYSSMRVAIPACCPSRASLFTGRYPHNDGVLLQGDATKLDTDDTVMAYAKSLGYATALAGKFLVNWPGGTRVPYFDKQTVITGGYTDYTAWVDGSARTVSTYSTTFLAQQLRTYLTGFEANDSQPWFAYWAPQAPHIAGAYKTLATPEAKYATAPVGPCAKPGEADRSDKPAYVSWTPPDPTYAEAVCESQLRTLMSVDDQIAAFFAQLKATGEIHDTMVIVTSDNGYHWGEQGWFSKFYPYEPSVRVPLWIRWDGHVTAGADARLASFIDILPTLLGVWQFTPAEFVDGRSLFSTATRTDYLTEYFYDNVSNGPFPSWASLTNATRKYVETYTVSSTGAVSVFKEYYRLTTDPGELVNVLRDGDPANDPPASELTALAAELVAARTCTGTSCP